MDFICQATGTLGSARTSSAGKRSTPRDSACQSPDLLPKPGREFRKAQQKPQASAASGTSPNQSMNHRSWLEVVVASRGGMGFGFASESKRLFCFTEGELTNRSSSVLSKVDNFNKPRRHVAISEQREQATCEDTPSTQPVLDLGCAVLEVRGACWAMLPDRVPLSQITHRRILQNLRELGGLEHTSSRLSAPAALRSTIALP